MNLLAFGSAVLSLRLLVPYSGAWILDATLDAEAAPVAGAPAIVAGEAARLVGTVDPDPDRTFKFGEQVRLGVLAGGGGWHKTVVPRHFHSDAALALGNVASVTAAEVKETVVVAPPVTLGKDFFRVAGPASQVLRGHAWWVDFDGITHVGPRPPSAPPESLEILSWDEDTGTATASVDGLVTPGTVLVDERFGMRIVRDVELVMAGSNIRATLWLVSSLPTGEIVSELAQALGAIASRAIGPQWLRTYEYTVISMQGDRVAVAPVNPAKAPAAVPLSIWCGVPGAKSSLVPGTRVLVGFIDGDPLKPYVSAFEPAEGPGWVPLTLSLDAVAKVAIGENATLVELGGAGALPVARAPAVIAFAGAVQAAMAAQGTVPAAPMTGANFAAAAAAIAQALVTLTDDCPSTKVISV